MVDFDVKLTMKDLIVTTFNWNNEERTRLSCVGPASPAGSPFFTSWVVTVNSPTPLVKNHVLAFASFWGRSCPCEDTFVSLWGHIDPCIRVLLRTHTVDFPLLSTVQRRSSRTLTTRHTIIRTRKGATSASRPQHQCDVEPMHQPASHPSPASQCNMWPNVNEPNQLTDQPTATTMVCLHVAPRIQLLASTGNVWA